MKTLVLGIGNLLMGDEGVGIHVVRRLQETASLPGVSLVDGGTGGLGLLGELGDYERIVLVDAVMDGNPPGTVRVLRPRFSADYPRTLAAHDIGLKDLLDAAVLTGSKAEILLVAVSVPAVDRPSLDLTPGVRSCIDLAVAAVREVAAIAG